MALLKTSLALLALSANMGTAQRWTQEDLDEQNRNSECANDCLFDAWPEGYCVEDPACQCNNQKNREEYLCCVAEKCVTDFWKETLELTSDNCDAFGIPFTFDVEGACGFTPPTSSTSTSSAESETATATASETSAASSEATETATQDQEETETATQGEEESETASATASPTASRSEGDSAETSSPPNGAAAGQVSWGLAAVVAGAGMLL